MNDQQKIKALKNAIRNLINVVPVAYPMPIGWDKAVENAEFILQHVK